MLNVNELNVSYGAIHALKGISFELNEGEIVALIGANGAGKSTTLNTISGILRPDSGSILFEGEDLTQTKAAYIVKKGIVQVPEGRKIFAKMSVFENLEMGAYTLKDKELFEEHMEKVFEIFPRLEERQRQLGGTLSGGEQQMLAMGRGLMADPRLLLLDEPSMGLAPLLVEQIFEVIQDINQTGVSVLLVEQNAQMALAIADRAYVLETGTVALSGDAETLMENPQVKAAYLGG
ncbi:MAG: ABC transporter ATP-binding protein [Chloroflexota bacterium]|nr:ABC transporter ATP-binding protein [Chloroflexota bacterium]